jgi:predicted metal-dependent enzyme (double-stranded beta helix superfamily)
MTMTLHRTDHLAIAREVAANLNDWPLAPRYNATHRWSHRLSADPDAEVWLLTWLPGQCTDVHDHGGSAGAFMVVEGEVTEETFTGVRPTSARLGTGTGRRFGAHHVHRVANLGDRPAVSIHVYSPALTSMTRYRLEDGRLVVAAIERAGVQW